MKGNGWFISVFLPSLEERMNNERYPDSCLLSDRQAEVCMMHMRAEQHTDVNYGTAFTNYHYSTGSYDYYLYRRGKYNILNRYKKHIKEEVIWDADEDDE